MYTARLKLSPIGIDDVESLLDVFCDAAVRRYLLDDTEVSREWVLDEIASSNERFTSHGAGLWAIRLINVPRIIGFAGFRNFFDPPRLQLLYGLLPAYWGQGLATEAARRVCDHGFNELGFDRIEAAMNAPNEDSIALVLRLGMTPLENPVQQADTVFYQIDRESWNRHL